MTLKIGDNVRHVETKEEGKVVAISKETPQCVMVRFGKSFAYAIEREKLEPIAPKSATRVHRRL
jgi:hypothetical protein